MRLANAWFTKSTPLMKLPMRWSQTLNLERNNSVAQSSSSNRSSRLRSSKNQTSINPKLPHIVLLFGEGMEPPDINKKPILSLTANLISLTAKLSNLLILNFMIPMINNDKTTCIFFKINNDKTITIYIDFKLIINSFSFNIWAGDIYRRHGPVE
jgi:hypothetical protein